MPSPFRMEPGIIICDDVRREENKKEILIGVYNGIVIVPSLPFVLPQLAVRISVTLGKVAFEKVEFEILDPHKGRWMHTGGSSTFLTNTDPASITFVAAPAMFQSKGTYQLLLGMDSPLRKIGKFEIRLPQAPAS